MHYPCLARKGSRCEGRAAQGRKDERAEGGGEGRSRDEREKREERERVRVRGRRDRERGRALRRGGCPRLRFVGNGRSITRRSSYPLALLTLLGGRQGPLPPKDTRRTTLSCPPQPPPPPLPPSSSSSPRDHVRPKRSNLALPPRTTPAVRRPVSRSDVKKVRDDVDRDSERTALPSRGPSRGFERRKGEPL